MGGDLLLVYQMGYTLAHVPHSHSPRLVPKCLLPLYPNPNRNTNPYSGVSKTQIPQPIIQPEKPAKVVKLYMTKTNIQKKRVSKLPLCVRYFIMADQILRGSTWSNGDKDLQQRQIIWAYFKTLAI